MNKLRNLLKSEKLSFSQYFEEAYKLFNEMIRNDNRDIIIILVLSLISVFFKNFIGTLASFVNLVRIWLFYKKVIFKIERKKYKADDTIIKSLILLGIIAVAGFLSALFMIPFISQAIKMGLYGERGFKVLATIIIPIVILLVVYIVVSLFILYFIPAYISRNGSIIETFKYNLFLCKNNRMRMFVPIVILIILGLLIGIVLNFLGIIGAILFGIVNGAINIFQVIIISIIYLNVEYNAEIPEEFSFAKETENNKTDNESKELEYISPLEEKKDDENN